MKSNEFELIHYCRRCGSSFITKDIGANLCRDCEEAQKVTKDDIPSFMTLTEACELSEAKRTARLKVGRWGGWYLCGKGKWLGFKGLYPNKTIPYEFELTSDSPLRLFCHLRDKTWPHRGDLEDLLAAFNDIFGYSWLNDEVYGKGKGN